MLENRTSRLPAPPPREEWTREIFVERYAQYHDKSSDPAFCREWAGTHWLIFQANRAYTPDFMH